MDFLNEGNENEFDDILAEMEKEMNMADMLKELGPKCTSDVPLCKDLLSSFSPLTEATVARILGTIIRSDTGLQDHENALSTFYSAIGKGTLSDMTSLNTWNTDVLIDSIKQLVSDLLPLLFFVNKYPDAVCISTHTNMKKMQAPGISWITVIENLDHEGFYVPDEAAFSQLVSCYRRASQVLLYFL